MKQMLFAGLGKVFNIVKKLDTRTDEDVYRELYTASSISEKKFYNIGAGSFQHPCWTNIDGSNEHFSNLNGSSKINLFHELFDHTPIPLKDDSAELVYTSHTIEHIDDASVNYLFNDCYRMMKKGGVFRIVTPDINLSYEAWKRNDRKFFFWSEWDSYNRDFKSHGLAKPFREASTSQIFLDDFASSASEVVLKGADRRITDSQLLDLFDKMSYEEALNYCTSLCSIALQKEFPERHINWFNEKKLLGMLSSAGFSTVYKSGYLQSSAAVLRNPNYFDNTLPQLSIFMEAVK